MACIRKRRGKWVVDFRDNQGKRRWETYPTRREADAALAERLKQVRTGAYVAPAALPKFKDVAAGWLATKQNHRPSSVGAWESHVHAHLVPVFGEVRVDRIRVDDLEKLRDDKAAGGLSATMVNKLLQTLSAILRYAQRKGFVQVNVATLVDRLRKQARQVTAGEIDFGEGRAIEPGAVLSPTETAALIQNAPAGLCRAYIMGALLTGARGGELCALTWDDIDLEAATMRITRSLSWEKTRGERGGEALPRFFPPKTRSAIRTLNLAPELVSELRRWKLACPKGPENLVYPNASGGPMHRSWFTTRLFRKALEAAGIERRFTLHGLRHTFASVLILQGRPVTQVARILGHKSPDVTLSTYSHWFDALESDEAMADAARLLVGSQAAAVAGR